MNLQTVKKLVTPPVSIVVTTEFVPTESDVDERTFTHKYTVDIQNVSDRIVQLINRHWMVFSGGFQTADIKGEGVIGQQPIIKPGETHTYSSWCVTRDSVAWMEGSYTFYCEKGTFFDAVVPKFDLIYTDTSSVH